jgi:hypothetical protein
VQDDVFPYPREIRFAERYADGHRRGAKGAEPSDPLGSP